MAGFGEVPTSGGSLAVTPVLLNFFTALGDYIDSLFNWPPEPQTDEGELFWEALTLAVSFGFMIMVGRWWQR